MLATSPVRRARRTRLLVGAFVVAVLGASAASQVTADLVPTDLLDLSAAPYDPDRFPDRNVADAVLSAGGDDAATSRLLGRLSPDAATAVDRQAFDEVAIALAAEELTVEGVLERSNDLFVVLVRAGEDDRYYVALAPARDDPELIEGLLINPFLDVDGGPLSDVEFVLIAATVLALVAAGLMQPSGGRWYVAAGLVLCVAFAELTPWVVTQDLAILAVPAALVVAAIAVGDGRLPVAVLAVTAVAAAASLVPVLTIDPGTAGAGFGHLLTIESLTGHADAAQRASSIATIIGAATVFAWFTVGGRTLRNGRRGLAWRVGGGQVACVSVAGVAIAGLASPAPIDLTASGWAIAGLLAVGGGRIAQLARRHADLADVSARIADLGTGRHGDLATVIGRALDDPSAQVLHARGDGFVDRDGQVASLPLEPDRFTLLVVDDETVGAVVHAPAVAADPERLRATCDAVKLSLANERLAAQIRWQLEEVRASRHRLVQAEEQARARLERDLHDGAQQRLTAAMLDLRVAQARATGVDAELASSLDPIGREIQGAIDEIRELARGVRPAALDGGLRAAADDLAERAPLPVTVRDSMLRRPAPDTETVAYFVISEALTNAGRHGRAGHVGIELATDDASLHVTIADDGIGIDPGLTVTPGERPPVATGTGLVGLFDRVDAHGGTLSIRREPSGGTTIEVRLPCER